ncbi:phenylalanine--tRNA ligase subunit beta [Gudongella oleilytica]|jgi:phenylalanyl-tRNA synthetase beta chain|uniref:phenylalanine--tRNA ligase subunit beta n=1 Tax=Gudongella oleilytica TaxID=1582259 RepID=UPI000EEE2ED6|nr:phenylalanine--tRNA ligase subunit beta [Gudongella oleilytica]HCO18593.1 phenylalanine--tRNA ligase subunit beta [Tissierellales bacterium]HMM69225.1 phenylalanine--tRNA ligase subunit beta [Gudongella oleilytica]
MLLPLKWLGKYVNIEISPKELADGLTYSGSHVESITRLDKGIENVVVGRINEIERHPNADKLFVCKVDLGDKLETIVTGATNLKKGDYVPVAINGAVLAGGVSIGSTVFRGIESNGMLCSLQELGYPDNVIPKEVRDGIFVFDKEYPLGADAIEYLQLDEDVIEFEITPNRPDCLSIYGMARETAATFGWELEYPRISIKHEADDINDYTQGIFVETPNCKRYYSRVVKDVKIGPSPLWLQTTLMNAGVRPISNIVDVTNFVMLELGEPLHAFDLDMLQGRKIIVRQAKSGESLTTLDGTERTLGEDDIIIADASMPIGIAGVMGGLDSEITQGTTTVLLEGANFSSRHIRMTSKKFGLRTEASSRFEKGIDPNLCKMAVERACQLIEEIGAGTVVKGEIDVNQSTSASRVLTLRPDRARLLIGTDIADEEMIGYLTRLEFKALLENGLIKAEVPSFRDDVEGEADLIEEVGRIYGFHRVESKPLVGGLTRGERPYNKQMELKVKNVMQGLGYNEVMTYSFISPKAYDKLNLPEDAPERKYIRLMNPLGEDYSTMRTTLLSNMMELLYRNEKRGIDEVLAYEIGSVFIPGSLPVTDLPDEKQVLSIGVYGSKDFYFVKESLQMVFGRMGIRNLRFKPLSSHPSFHPGRTAEVYSGDESMGYFGEIHPDVLENYDIKNKVYAGVIDFDQIIRLANPEVKYKPLPKYPAVTRDIAVVVDESVLVGELEETIIENGEGLVEAISLFDIYRGNQVQDNKKSVAFSIVYRSYEGTLTEDIISRIQRNTITGLENKHNAKLRS